MHQMDSTIYIDFCPSESLKENTPTPDSTFISSACVFRPIHYQTEDDIKKFSKNRKEKKLRKTLRMLENKEIDIAALCFTHTEKYMYDVGFLNIEKEGVLIDDLIEDVRRESGFDYDKNKIVSTSAVLLSAYISCSYLLTMLKGHDLPLLSCVEIIIDRPPGDSTEKNNYLFNKLDYLFYKKMKLIIEEEFETQLSIRRLGIGEEDPAGMKIADHIAYSQSLIKMIDPNDINTEIKRSPQLPNFDNKKQEIFEAIDKILSERESLVRLTFQQVMDMDKLMKKGYTLTEAAESIKKKIRLQQAAMNNDMSV